MATMNIAIEIGTSHTSVYLESAVVVLREPTAVAYVGDGDNKSVVAVGERAMSMMGKTPDKTTVVCPVVDGYIVDVDACKAMMSEYIKRILPVSYIFFPKIKAILVTPTGLTVDERKVYEDVVVQAGVAEVTLVDNVIATALGFDLPIASPAGGFVVNIGGGITEIALISVCGIISGCSVNVGGSMMDRALMDYLVGKYGLKVGGLTARRIREEIGTLYNNDVSYLEVKGININTLTPSTQCVYAEDTCAALLPYYARIADAIQGVTNLCPPELSSSVQGSGVFVAGGCAKIPGVEKVLGEILEIPVTVAEEPELVSVLGAGKLIGNKDLIKQIRSQQ
ncbi:MAG: rod shape-determining protein [Clostridia bacterium]|nr:rod shape-determining protein [Clostridia bacterium]